MLFTLGNCTITFILKIIHFLISDPGHIILTSGLTLNFGLW